MAAESVVGVVPNNWERTTLGAVVERGGGVIQTGPFGSELHASDYVPVGIPSIMPTNIGENRVVTENIARIRPEDAARLSRYLVRKGDIVYSRRGDIERRALIRDQEEGWLCGTGCLMVRLGEDSGVNPIYASYYLSHSAVRQWLVQHAVGDTMANLNTAIMQALPFVVPPPSDQTAITAILGSLDDKIDLSQRINTLLQATARAVFKAWFIDFEPVNARARGKTTFRGMPKDVFEQLPAEFSESELGLIPNGWMCTQIGELVEVVGGGTPSTKAQEFWDGGEYPFCTPKDMSKLTSPVLLDTERHLTRAGVDKVSSGQLPIGTVLLSSRAPIGYLAIAETPVSVNQGIIAMITREIPNTYILLWTESNMEEIEARAGGSTFAEINKQNFRSIPALRPDDRTLAAFGEITRPLFNLIASNQRESEVLAAIRDALLPKLISGKIRVPGSRVDDGR
jgi:type I restriction enzyme, S subunit